jgi:hypothetical protein
MIESNDFRAPPQRDKYRDKHINRMTAVAVWTMLVIFLGFVVAVAARVFVWIWP